MREMTYDDGTGVKQLEFTLKDVLIDYLHVKKNYRTVYKKDDMELLKKNMLVMGIISPLIVFKRGKDNYEVVDGNRRLIAAKEARNAAFVKINELTAEEREDPDMELPPFEFIKCNVINKEDDYNDFAEIVQLSVNETARNSPIDAAYKIAELVDSTKVTLTEIAEIIGYEYNYCTKMYAVTKYNNPLLRAFLTGNDIYFITKNNNDTIYSHSFEELLQQTADPTEIKKITGSINTNKIPFFSQLLDELTKSLKIIYDENRNIVNKFMYTEYNNMIADMIKKGITETPKIKNILNKFINKYLPEQAEVTLEKKTKETEKDVDKLRKMLLTIETNNETSIEEINNILLKKQSKYCIVPVEEYHKYTSK